MPETEDQQPEQTPATQESPSGEDFATLFAASEAQSQRQRVAVGDLVVGRVIAIGQSSAFVAIGGKGDATIDLVEFRDPASGEVHLAVGDQIEATVVDDGSRSGAVVLKRMFGRGGHLSAELEQALAHKIPVEGVVTGEVKGGFEVQIGSTRAFCPGSQIDRRRGGERVPGAQYIGQRFPFRIIKIESGGRNVVVSRRDLLEEEAKAEAAKTWEQIQVGAVLSGRVSSVREFGAFVDLGGVEGMIHVSQLGYGRVKHPGDALQVGQQVEVQVIKVEDVADKPGRKQIGLSMKSLAVDPWSQARQNFPVGHTGPGVVRRLEPFGAFVEVAPGLEGLVHISKITLDRRLSHARQELSVGQNVEVTVVGIDEAQRRMALSMVEQAKTQRDNEMAAERREQDALVAKNNQRTSFGSLGDLLSRSQKR